MKIHANHWATMDFQWPNSLEMTQIHLYKPESDPGLQMIPRPQTILKMNHKMTLGPELIPTLKDRNGVDSMISLWMDIYVYIFNYFR